jgi:hypothetical protein
MCSRKALPLSQLFEEPRTLNTTLFVSQYIFIAPGKIRDEADSANNISKPEIAAEMKLR